MTETTKNRELTYAGIDNTCLRTSIEQARQYFDAGVDAVVAHLPEYYPLTGDHMLEYFKALADECGGPLIIYNIPATTGMSIPLDVLDKLSRHTNIAGLKDSERDLKRTDQSIALWKDREDFSLLIGWAAQSTYTLTRGADGIVPSTGNLVPALYRDLYQVPWPGMRKRQKHCRSRPTLFQRSIKKTAFSANPWLRSRSA